MPERRRQLALAPSGSAIAPGGYSATDLHDRSRPLHQPRILLRNAGWVCVLAAAALSLLGAVTIAGTTEPALALKHLKFAAVGLLAAAVVALPHYRRVRDLSYLLMFVVLAMLVFVLIPWVPETIVRPRNGARRWINLYVTNFQPSELAKIAYTLALANYLRCRSSYRRFLGLLVPLVLTVIPMGLVLVEPDLGTAMLFLPTLFAVLIAAGARMRHLVIIVALGLAAAPLSYPVLKPHQKARIKAALAQLSGDEGNFENDIGYQGSRAMTLVGAGGLFGVGKEHAVQLVKHNHLPEDHNDMIFAVICCRWGVLGALVTLSLFAVFVLGGLVVAVQCKDPFGRLTAVGLVATLFAQMSINAGMTIGLLPITGMTLPFVSYGGSSLVCAWLTVGLLMSIAVRRSPFMMKDAFEFDDEVDA
ncbi:MAG: FtsW/RodA/SpoVE family cell cycle protein [Planctomycetota bacterium]